MTEGRGVPAGASGCLATTKRGDPCRSRPLPGGAYCAFHAPDLAERRAAARSAGAVKSNKLRSIRGQRARLDSPTALARFLGGIIHDVVEGRLDPDVGRVAIYGSAVLRQTLEASEIEKRLAALEAIAPQNGAGKWRA